MSEVTFNMNSIIENVRTAKIYNSPARKAKKRYGNCEWCSLLDDRMYINFWHEPDKCLYMILACLNCMRTEPWKYNPNLVKKLHNSSHSKEAKMYGNLSKGKRVAN